jgi:hypothetical protein
MFLRSKFSFKCALFPFILMLAFIHPKYCSVLQFDVYNQVLICPFHLLHHLFVLLLYLYHLWSIDSLCVKFLIAFVAALVLALRQNLHYQEIFL